MKMDIVEGDFESMEIFPIQNISGISLVDKDSRHHEIFNASGDNHGVILVDGVDTLEVPIRKGDKRKTLL